MKNENTERTKEQTIKAVFALVGLSPEQAEKTLQRQCKPIPRDRKHYQFTDAKGVRHYPDLTIDEALEVCKSYEIETNEQELRNGVRFADYGFIRDSYKDGSLEHAES
jgi:hypothetical protein